MAKHRGSSQLWTAAVLASFAAGPPLSAGAPELRVGAAFPDLVLPSIADGKLAAISSFRGRKVYLVVFASW